MIQTLPPELLIHIFECLDFESLRKCSRVCRLWGEFMKWTHGEEITFGNRREITQWASSTGNELGGPGQVRIRGSRGEDEAERLPIQHLAAFAAVFARKWTRVRNLHIERAVWRAADMSRTLFWDLSLYRITHLFLTDVTFPAVGAFGRLLHYLPALEIVSCRNVTFVAPGFNPRGFPTRTRVQRQPIMQLVVWSATYETVVDLCTFFEYVPHIAAALSRFTLSVRFDWFDVRPHSMISCVQRVYDAAGASLREVSLYDTPLPFASSAHDSAELSAPVIDLSRNTGLTRLEIRMTIDREDVDHSVSYRTLAKVSSPAIRYVILINKFRWTENLSQVHDAVHILGRSCLTQIDEILASQTFASLEQFHIVLCIKRITLTESQELALPSLILPYMPKLSARGKGALKSSFVYISPWE